ncbi:MAG: hypothetical protein HGB01_04650 [Chlorobiaceae bacterium]|nr:hypothetical protein [Chlorobiaceae bacterium]
MKMTKPELAEEVVTASEQHWEADIMLSYIIEGAVALAEAVRSGDYERASEAAADLDDTLDMMTERVDLSGAIDGTGVTSPEK